MMTRMIKGSHLENTSANKLLKQSQVETGAHQPCLPDYKHKYKYEYKYEHKYANTNTF